jgi:CheY-like chemotaxis protein
MKKVVIIDDDIDLLYQLKVVLTELLIEVVTFENSNEALLYITKNRPDLVIVDLMMESNDIGFINAKKIKKLYADVPIILLSAVGAETGISFTDLSSETSQLYVNEIIDKGKSFDYIKNVIKKYIA